MKKLLIVLTIILGSCSTSDSTLNERGNRQAKWCENLWQTLRTEAPVSSSTDFVKECCRTNVASITNSCITNLMGFKED
jgi:hypothetical protein